MKRWSLKLAAAAAAVVLPLSFGLAAQASVGEGATCKIVQGRYSSQPVPPPTCTSPAGFCTEGTLTGGANGSYAFTARKFLSAEEPTAPGVMFYTGISMMNLGKEGSLVGTDTGTIDMGPSGQQAALITITDGADGLEGATGYLVLRGMLDQATGLVVGDYTGEICVP